MSTPKPTIDALLEMDPASFADAIDGQTVGVKEAVRQEIEARLATLDKAAWGGERKMRGYNRLFQSAKFDYERLDQTQQWLAGQFHEAFALIYADPAGAAAACWAYEQKHGAPETARVLRTAPDAFGALRGFSLLGFASAARRQAAAHAAKFDFAAYRHVFNLASETARNLLLKLQEVSDVAKAS